MFKNIITFLMNTPWFRFKKKQQMIALAQYGDGLYRLEAMVTKCGKELLQNLKAKGNSAFNPRDLIRMCDQYYYEPHVW